MYVSSGKTRQVLVGIMYWKADTNDMGWEEELLLIKPLIQAQSVDIFHSSAENRDVK